MQRTRYSHRNCLISLWDSSNESILAPNLPSCSCPDRSYTLLSVVGSTSASRSSRFDAQRLKLCSRRLARSDCCSTRSNVDCWLLRRTPSATRRCWNGQPSSHLTRCCHDVRLLNQRNLKGQPNDSRRSVNDATRLQNSIRTVLSRRLEPQKRSPLRWE